MSTAIPVQKGKTYTIHIDALGSNAEGIGRIEGFAVFVPHALPGETVEIRMDETKKHYATGRVLRILQESPDRVAPKCALYHRCGGCQLQHLSYEGQLKAKQQQVIDAITRIGKQPSILVHPTLGAKSPWNYRNKMQFPVGRHKGGVAIGCFAQGSHEIIDTDCCHIQKNANNAIANAMRDITAKLNIPIYDEDRHTGVLRHIVGRVGKGGECMAVLVTATRDLRQAKQITKMLRERVPALVSIQQNVQTYRNNVIMGRETNLLWGRPTILDEIGSLSFHISPRSFFQVNTEQANVLYRRVLDYAGLTGRETVIDAYCGTGTITLFLAKKAQRAYGIEIVQPAIRDARKNARDNHVGNAEFIVGDATAVMPRLYREGIHADVVVVDPPRAGCSPEVLRAFARMMPRRIVYVSCNPASLARDLVLLGMLGYQAMEIQPVDLFSQTAHVEAIALIQRSDS